MWQLQSWLDVNWFILRVIRRKSPVWLAFLLLIFASGLFKLILYSPKDFLSWCLTILGAIGLSVTMYSFVLSLVRAPKARLISDDRIHIIFTRLALPADYVNHGYQIVPVPTTGPYDERVIRSLAVDSFLRVHDFKLIEDCAAIQKINGVLQNDPKTYEDALRCQFRMSARNKRSKKGQRFDNETKTCLASDLAASDESPLTIYKGSYFHGFLTNELVTQMMESTDQYPIVTFRGSEHFPAYTENERYIIKPVTHSFMSNHIGVSTLVHTTDGKLALWRQTGAAMQSQFLLAPTGSGSCDWADWERLPEDRRTLGFLISRAMEREFREESHPLKSALQNVDLQTHIFGFFRWVRRGGKPEFVGISKANVHSQHLKPNLDEVDAPTRFQILYPAASISEIKDSIERMQVAQLLSVPLWVSIKCLQECLIADEPRLAYILFGRT